jgi:hypothetical protein
MGILMRFRPEKQEEGEKAFLQILIHPDHCQIVRFIWVDDLNAENPTFKVYCWKRLSFGLTSSPFILRVVLTSHLEKYETQHPSITSRVLEKIYVYDWMGGEKSPQGAAENIRLVFKILWEIKMKLCKTTTNLPELKEILRG